MLCHLVGLQSVQLYKNGIYEETKDRRFKDGQIYILSICCYGSIKKAVNS